MKRLIKLAAASAVAIGLLAAPAAAQATETCVPVAAIPAYTEVVPDIEHPAVGEPTITVENPDYVPAVEASTVWYNFAPNEKGKLEGAPTFPEDERGKWVGPHTEGGPGQDQEGVYQQGQGHGSWFYRDNTPGTPAVGEPTITVPNPDYVAAYTEIVPDIEHPEVPAVTCPPIDEEPPTEEPPTEEPEEPVVVNPPAEQPPAAQTPVVTEAPKSAPTSPTAAKVAEPVVAEELAATGFDARPLIWLALAAAIGGFVFLFVARLRRQ